MLLGILKSAFRTILSSLEYQNEYGRTCITNRGEKVKSRSEKRIADYLFHNNIIYEYEKPALTGGWIFKHKIGNPDFYLTEYDVYIEYWGLVNAHNRRVKAEYTRIMKWKMAQYHKNKIKFISIYPDNMGNFDWIFRAKLREVAGIELHKQPQFSSIANGKFGDVPDDKLIKLLGRYHEKVTIFSNANHISIRQKKWLKRDEWSDLNEILKANSFTWSSNGKESCWIKVDD